MNEQELTETILEVLRDFFEREPLKLEAIAVHMARRIYDKGLMTKALE